MCSVFSHHRAHNFITGALTCCNRSGFVASGRGIQAAFSAIASQRWRLGANWQLCGWSAVSGEGVTSPAARPSLKNSLAGLLSFGVWMLEELLVVRGGRRPPAHADHDAASNTSYSGRDHCGCVAAACDLAETTLFAVWGGDHVMLLVTRVALFAAVGVVWMFWWVWTDPAARNWPHALVFSGMLLLLAIAIPQVARLAGGQTAFRVSLIAAGGAALSSVANLFEDGLRIDGFVYGFVLGLLVLEVGLLTLAGVVAFTGCGPTRFVAVVPLGTVAAALLGLVAGGPIALATWLTAAGLTIALPRLRAMVAGLPPDT